MTDKNQLVEKIAESPEDRLFLRRVLDCEEKRDRQSVPAVTRFMTGRQQLLSMRLL